MGFAITFLKYASLALVLVLFVVYKLNSRAMNYWKKKGYPYVQPLPIVGNYLDALLARISIAEMYQKFYDQMSSKKYFGIYLTFKPVLIIRDPEIIMRILIKDFNVFFDRGFHVDKNDFLGTNLFFNRNPKWKQQRIKIMPVFSSAKLKAMHDLIDKSCKDLTEYISSTTDIIETKKLTADVFTDIVCKVLCGIEMNSMKNMNKEHLQMQAKALAPSLRQKIKSVLDFVFPSIGKKIYFFPTVIYGYFSNLILGTAKLRKEKNIRRNDVIQLMCDIYEKEQMLPSDQRAFDQNDFVGVIFVFLLAGYETSHVTTSLTLNALAYQKDIQDQVREQLRDIYEKNGEKFDYDQLKKMTLLEQAISETLRLYPLVNALFRECMEDYVIPGTNQVIERKTLVHIPTYAIQRDPQYWTDPEKYDISRFSEENISKIVPGSYLPFGDGPRVCIGKRFAMLQLKMVLANIILNYEVSPCKGSTRYPSIQTDSMLASPKEQLLLRFTRISQ